MLSSLTLRLLRQLFYLLPLFCLLLVSGIIIADQINQNIFSPPRRALHSYHQERLQNPGQFGLNIREHACLAGKVPCLLVEPTGRPGKRGRVLRQQLTEKGLRLAPYGTVHGTIVLLHGRNGRKEDLLPVAERFVAAGFRCLIPDLPGHGDSPLPAMAFGSSSFEQDIPGQALADARRHFNLPDDPTVLWGMSMGGAFAVSAAKSSAQDWDALIAVSSFAALDQVLKLYLPKRWHNLTIALQPLLDIAQWLKGAPTVSNMRPQQWAKAVSLPTLIVHGERDRYVPMQQGRELYSALGSTNKHWITVPGGGHTNVLATSMPLYAEMSAWLLQTLND